MSSVKRSLPSLVERIAVEREFYSEIPALLHAGARADPRSLLLPGQHTFLPDRNDTGDGLPLSGDDELLTRPDTCAKQIYEPKSLDKHIASLPSLVGAALAQLGTLTLDPFSKVVHLSKMYTTPA